MNLEDKILEQIKEKQLKPKSFWYFLIKDYTLWSLVLLSVILASIAFAPIIFIFQNLELGYIKHISDNVFLFILWALPYTWIILCILTTYLAMKAWEKTKHGYKFDGKKIFAGSLFASLVLGVILNYLSFGKRIDDEFRNVSMGNYRSFEDRRDGYWFDPETGRLIGKITSVSTSSFIVFNQKNNFIKEIFFDATTLGDENIFSENNIRIIAYNNFACAVFPDNFKPGTKNIKEKEKKEILNILASTTLESEENQYIHTECKNIFENGRAYFKPTPRENKLK
jgi:hypothetical protein